MFKDWGDYFRNSTPLPIARPIGPNALRIAAHALALDVPLVAHRPSELRCVPGLTAET